MEPVYVGVDVSKDRLDVHVLPSGEAFGVARDAEGLEELCSRLLPLAPSLVALESTGGFESVAIAALQAAHLPAVAVNPAFVRHYAQALGKRAKTDRIDALVIARFAESVKPAFRPLPDEDTRRLGDLVARRRQIVEMITAEKMREKRSSEKMKRSIKRLSKALQKELSEIEADIDDAVKGSDDWRRKEELMTSVPGVGQTIARTLLAEMPELGNGLSRREAAGLAGLAPYTQSSGKWRGQSRTAGGRDPVKHAAFMAAMTAVRCNRDLKLFYDRLLAAGKPKMLALIAVARKLLIILNAILRDQKPWRKNEQIA